MNGCRRCSSVINSPIFWPALNQAGLPTRARSGNSPALVIEEVKPFTEYKARLGQAQTEGKLRSLVWPLFFDHARHEAERLTRRMEQYSGGSSEFERSEVVPFWSNIMEEHARFVAHLLDPDETALIETCYKTSDVFQELGKGGLGGAASAFFRQPGTVASSLASNPETDAVLSAAETILDFKTKAARDIEAAQDQEHHRSAARRSCSSRGDQVHRRAETRGLTAATRPSSRPHIPRSPRALPGRVRSTRPRRRGGGPRPYRSRRTAEP